MAATLKINEKFWDTFNTEARYILKYGGRGSGKSHSEAQNFVLKACQPQYFRGVLVREIMGDIRESQYREIKEILDDTGLISQFDIQENTMTFTNNLTKNRIISKGFKKSQGGRTGKFKSIKDPTHVWIEEADECTQDDFIKADTSLRTTKAPHVQITMTFNPEDVTHWIYRRWFKEDPDENVLINHSTYHDNIDNLQPAYIEALEKMKEYDPNYYDVYVLGIWGNKKVDNQFAFNFNRNDHCGDTAVFDPNKRVYLSIDFNINPFGAICFHIFSDENGEHCHVFDEISIEKGNLQKMADAIISRFLVQLPSIEITGDAMGNNQRINRSDNNSLFVELIKMLGLRVKQLKTPPNPRHKKSREQLNYFLYHFNDFKINPKTCPNTIRELEITGCDTYGQIIKKDRKKLAERADLFDCVRYLENTYFYKWRSIHQNALLRKKRA